LEGYNAWGLLVGPVIGSFLNYYFGFAMPLFLYATIVLVLLMILMKQLPNENALGKQNLKDPVSVPYLKLLKSEKITIIMMVGILVLGSRHY
jgi:predicted MFS family arabinose efflux permease